MSYCTDCIHYKVCGNEGIDDSAMTFCADKKTSGDLISKSVLDQIKWERDIAIEQLKDLGYELGEKPRTGGDLISRQAVIDNIKTRLWQTALNNDEYITSYANVCEDIADNRIDTWVNELPSAEKTAEETNLTSEELFDLDIEQNIKDIDSGEDDSYYQGRLAGMLSAYRILKGKPYEEGEQTE